MTLFTLGFVVGSGAACWFFSGYVAALRRAVQTISMEAYHLHMANSPGMDLVRWRFHTGVADKMWRDRKQTTGHVCDPPRSAMLGQINIGE